MMVLFNADEGYIKVTMMNDSIRGGDGVITPKGGWCKNWAKTPEELVAVLDANNVDVYEDNLYHSSDVDDCNDYGFTFIWEAHDIINEALAIIDKRLMKCEAIPLVDRAEIVHGGIGNSKVRRPDNKYAYYRDERVDRVNKRKGYNKLAADHVYRSHAGGVAAAIRDDAAMEAEGIQGGHIEYDRKPAILELRDNRDKNIADMLKARSLNKQDQKWAEIDDATVDHEYQEAAAAEGIAAAIERLPSTKCVEEVDNGHGDGSWTVSGKTDEQLEKDLEALSQY
jgi:hypothetical protein